MMAWDIIISFGSLVLIPFFGMLNLPKCKLFPWFCVFMVIWLVGGLVIIGGGVTPIGQSDIISHSEKEAWLGTSKIIAINKMWLFGLIIGVPLLIITWLIENSKNKLLVLRQIKTIIAIIIFVGGICKFIREHAIKYIFP